MHSGQHDFAEAWFLFFAPFSNCYVLHFYGRNQNPIDGSDSRECMNLSLSTSTHSTSKLTVHYHRDFTQAVINILTTLELCCGSVICTAAMFCQRCVHVWTLWDYIFVYIRIWWILTYKMYIFNIVCAFFISCSHRPIDIFLI